MCELCTKHGEGKKWYLNAKNYSYDLLSDISRREFARDHFSWIYKTYSRWFGLLRAFPAHMPILGPTMKAIVKKIFIYEHWGQIIPIEDVERILELTNSITRVPCVCRATTTGRKDHRLCFLVSIDPGKMGIANVIDPSFFGGPDVAKFESVTREWTLGFIRENQSKGMINTIWSVKAPFVGVLCNCDYPTGCIAIKLIKEASPLTFRAEYVATVSDRCIGCKACVKMCPFDAVKYDNKAGKVSIILKRCQGCGICRGVCKENALALLSRQLVPKVANLW